MPKHQIIRVLLIVFSLTLGLGLISPLFDVDAALYATLSMEMLQGGSWLELYERGTDYLDKPPLLFWLSAVSYALLGIEAWAYKLPSLLAGFMALYYTYKVAKKYYNKETGTIAAMILCSSIGFVWMNSDVKTDLLLMSFLIAAVFHLSESLDHHSKKHALFFAIFCGLAMLSKGIMGFIFPIAVMIPHVLLKKKSLTLIRQPWWFILPVIGVILLPMCIGLYQQFDLHPEKWIHGKQGVSGLRFYFWEQSFGRVTGENKWSNNAPVHFLFSHALLLSAPASFLLPVFWFQKTKNKRWLTSSEYVSSYGGLLLLILMSFSQYKIPHYAAIVLPLIAVYIAAEISSAKATQIKIPVLFAFFIVLVISVMVYFVFRTHEWLLYFWMVLLFVSWLWRKESPVYVLLLAGGYLGLVFNAHLVPGLYAYTETPQVLHLIREQNIESKEIIFYNKHPRSLEFALKKRINIVPRNEVSHYSGFWLYMDEMGLNDLKSDGHIPKKLFKLRHHNAERIEFNFLNPKTRYKTLQKRYLVQF